MFYNQGMKKNILTSNQQDSRRITITCFITNSTFQKADEPFVFNFNSFRRLNFKRAKSPTETWIFYLGAGVKVSFWTSHLGCSTWVFHFKNSGLRRLWAQFSIYLTRPDFVLLAGTILSWFSSSNTSHWHPSLSACNWCNIIFSPNLNV